MDKKQFTQDIQSYLFTDAIAEGRWDIVNRETIGQDWPIVYFWVECPKAPNDEKKFFFKFNLEDYPNQAPEICIWDMKTNTQLANTERPRGTGDVTMTFRCDWKNGTNLYTPYERVALREHLPNWPNEYPLLSWKSGKDSILKPLEHMHSLLTGGHYNG